MNTKANTQGEKKLLPSITELLLETSLYAPQSVGFDDRNTLDALRDGQIKIDAHCVVCGRESIFRSRSSRGAGSGAAADANWMFSIGHFSTTIYCLRCDQIYRYYFRLSNDGLEKVGQYPSMEDILSADVKRFKKLLRPEDFAELRRAGGLYSHGIGIGSFVYLRRIFERLITLHHIELETSGMKVPDFDRKRIDEKIGLLASVLPPALVKHKKAYSILSKGLHELDEITCRKFYPALRAAIIQILEQDLQARSAKDAEIELEKQLEDIVREINAPDK